MAAKLTQLSNGTNMDFWTKSFKIPIAFLTMIFFTYHLASTTRMTGEILCYHEKKKKKKKKLNIPML